MSTDALIPFIDEETPQEGSTSTPAAPKPVRQPWRILIVDDDSDVHESTAYALRGLEIAERKLHLLHAHSSAEGIELLRREHDVAVILLDVVMETEHAGLAMVDTIRNGLNLHNTRIILRTGQPGQAPEIETIRRYDINDYKTKSELTRASCTPRSPPPSAPMTSFAGSTPAAGAWKRSSRPAITSWPNKACRPSPKA